MVHAASVLRVVLCFDNLLHVFQPVVCQVYEVRKLFCRLFIKVTEQGEDGTVRMDLERVLSDYSLGMLMELSETVSNEDSAVSVKTFGTGFPFCPTGFPYF